MGHGEHSSIKKIEAISIAQNNAIDNAFEQCYYLFFPSSANIDICYSDSTKHAIDESDVGNTSTMQSTKKSKIDNNELHECDISSKVNESNYDDNNNSNNVTTNHVNIPNNNQIESDITHDITTSIPIADDDESSDFISYNIAPFSFPPPVSLKGQKYPPSLNQVFPPSLPPPVVDTYRSNMKTQSQHQYVHNTQSHQTAHSLLPVKSTSSTQIHNNMPRTYLTSTKK